MNVSAPLVRPVRPDEAPALFRLYRRTVLQAYAHIFPPQSYPFPDEPMRTEWADVVARHNRAAQVLVAEIDGEVVGAALTTGSTLQNFFVVPEHWGGAAAGALHDAVLDACRAAGSTGCTLEVLAENSRARRFYQRRGWHLDGRRRESSYPPYPVVLGYAIDLG